MADRPNTPQTPTAAFPTPTAIKRPPTAARKPNPAVPVVKAADGKGWQRFESATEKDAKDQRALIGRAKDELGVKARTRTHREGGKPNPLVWYLLVGDEPTETTS